MIILGVDPDAHNTGLALVSVDAEGRPELVFTHSVKIPSGKKGYKGRMACILMATAVAGAINKIRSGLLKSASPEALAAVVEGQQHYHSKTRVNPQDLINLSLVSGSAIGACFLHGFHHVESPLPREWKGTVKKGIHQARICRCLKIECEIEDPARPVRVICLPEGLEGEDKQLAKGYWSHVLDAAGLAVWGAQKLSTRRA